jgi:RNA polymerase sigma-70 factor (ECF subfamily)
MANFGQSRRAFPTTRWSLVTQVFGGGESASSEALGELGLRYRYPVYAYVRRCGHAPAIARDITRSFLHHLQREVRKQSAPPDRGQFRRFLLERLHAWLADDWRRTHEDLDEVSPEADGDLEASYARDRMHVDSPDQAFQRGFALEVLAHAFDRLRAEVRQTGHLDMYETLAPFLGRDPEPGQYDEFARALRTRPLAIVVALKRLRQRLRELASEELADTVSSAEELATEQQALFAILQG